MSIQQHTDIYPVSLTDNDWAHILQNNHEAQDLLSTAIAQHEQYREDDPLKRKGALHHKLDQHQSNGAVHGDIGKQQFSEGDNSSDEGHSPGEGKPAPKKAGRKPLTTEPTNKRKAQNRAAQRAFRDRKERYVKSLEDRIKELEDLNPGKADSKLAEENTNLKVLVQKLETENYFLKEQSFTFDFPITQPGLYNEAKAQREALLQSSTGSGSSSSSPSPATYTTRSDSSLTSASTPGAGQRRSLTGSSVAKPPTYDQLPWSPPSSIGDSVPNSPLDSDLSTPEQETAAQPSVYSDNAGVVPRARNSTPEEIALFSSILDGTGNTYAPSTSGANTGSFAGYGTSVASSSISHQSPASTLALFSEHSPSPTIEEIVNAPLFADNHGMAQPNLTTSNLSMPALTYEQTRALFNEFRDPSNPQDFFAGLEDPIDQPFSHDTIGGLFNEQLLDYTTAFAIVAATPAREESQEYFGKVTESQSKPELQALSEGEKAIPCPQVWEQMAKHPNFDDADIDDLCAELKSKAKCSGHGPVIALADVNKLMDRLDQE
ncbi:DNA-binding transcription factor yap1 [Mortierella alpina]|uniref:DNA-binding transcription factor yap1 n=1 Tax=Mortierella alpina TaxID=64518 RepID=A0A9P6J3Y6_MORAP|nr:DNA-binding transcription factor yap1 [Mortierella alpina]